MASERARRGRPTGVASRRPSRRPLGPEPYVHLVWLAFLGFQPLFEPGYDAVRWLALAALVATFLPVYFWTWRQPGGAALPGILAMAAMGTLTTGLNAGAAGLLIYAAAAAGVKLPPRRAFVAIARLTAAVIPGALLSAVPWPYVLAAFLPTFVFVPLIGGLNVYYGSRDRTNARLHLAHDEIERLAAIAERERIARDLHDLLGHTLSVIVLKSELAVKLTAVDAERAAAEIGDVERISRRALGEVREAVVRYRHRGLTAELDGAREAFESAAVRLDVHLPPERPPPRVESVLAMVVREALTNVLRHAKAGRCDVTLRQDPDAWTLEVVDDGHGQLGPVGNGLLGLRERVTALGGRLELSGGRGVRLLVQLPTSVHG